MAGRKKKYSPEFKTNIVLSVLKEEKTIAGIASECGVHPNQISKWKKQFLEEAPRIFQDDRRESALVQAEYESKIEGLYTEIGRLSTRLSWLKKKSGIEFDEKGAG
jgi:transposase-like protein